MKTELTNLTITNDQLPKVFNKIKIEAITRKAIREGKDFSAIANILMADSYFQEKERQMGVQKVAQMTRETVKKALAKERNTKMQAWLEQNPS